MYIYYTSFYCAEEYTLHLSKVGKSLVEKINTLLRLKSLFAHFTNVNSENIPFKQKEQKMFVESYFAVGIRWYCEYLNFKLLFYRLLFKKWENCEKLSNSDKILLYL